MVREPGQAAEPEVIPAAEPIAAPEGVVTNPTEGSPEGIVQPPAPAEPDPYQEVMTKKGFKSQGDFAKSYVEAESALGREQTRVSTIKTQLESQGFTLDDNNQIVQMPQGPGQYQQQPGQGQQPVQGDPIYDPYTGEELTNPTDIQLAKMPLSQRVSVVANALLDQREQLNSQASTAESEVLAQPGAKGFEAELKAEMKKLPAQYRANKQAWEQTLLIVKGRKYEDALKNNGQQAVEQFINKENAQGIPAAGGKVSTLRLTPAQEQTFQWYDTNKKGMFRDRAHFLKVASDPNGGR